VSTEQVGLIRRCAECGERSRAHLDTDVDLVFDCPECAERRSDDWGSLR
jgi:DNA-directed RNA polymerase subunit RPC12/RpoP